MKASLIGPHGPTRRTVQGDRLPIEVNVPPAGVEGQHRQIAATAGTAQVDGPILVADPELAGFDCVELGQYVYEDGTEFHGRHSCHSFRCDDARRLESEPMEDQLVWVSVRRSIRRIRILRIKEQGFKLFHNAWPSEGGRIRTDLAPYPTQ